MLTLAENDEFARYIDDFRYMTFLIRCASTPSLAKIYTRLTLLAIIFMRTRRRYADSRRRRSRRRAAMRS